MINPLEAMMAARAANQGNAYGAGVQNTGAVNPEVLLAMQRMNTPTIGQRMDGQNSQMVDVDPYKYADLKQARDYQAAMNARTNNTKMQVANANALNQQFLANQLYDRNLERDDTAFSRSQELADTKYEREQQLLKDADEKARQRLLDAEAREQKTYERRLQEQQEAERMKLALTNEQFSSLRGPAMQAIQNQTYWNSGGEQETATQYYQDELSKRALMVGDEEIQKAYKSEKDYNPAVQLRRTDDNGNINPRYQEVANKLLMQDGNFTSIDQEIKKSVAERVRNTGSMIAQNFRAVSATMAKFGYSPGEVGDYTPDFGPNSLTAENLSGLPIPQLSDSGANPIGASELNLDTSTPQLQESAGEIESLQSVYDSLMMQAGIVGAKREAERSSNENMFQTGARNLAEVTNIVNPLTGEQGINPYRADMVGGIDQDEMDALGYAGVNPEDIAMFTNDIDDLPGLDAYSSPKERQAYIKAELERRIAVLQEALGNSQNSE